MMSSSLALMSRNAAFREGGGGGEGGMWQREVVCQQSMGRCAEKEGEGEGERQWDTQQEGMGGETREELKVKR